MEYRRIRLGSSTGTDSLGPFAACAFGAEPSFTGVRSVLWRRDLAGGGRMKKGAYTQLNLTHLEAALSQVLEAAQREQWTYGARSWNGHWLPSWMGANRGPSLDGSKRRAFPAKRR